MMLFQLIFDSAPDAIVVTNREGRIVRTNARAEELFGYANGELVGQLVEVLVPEPLRAMHVAKLNSLCTAHARSARKNSPPVARTAASFRPISC
jgi:PAS domain S-box-containing protein